MQQNVKIVKIENNELSPAVLHCSLFNRGMKLSLENKLPKRYVYDYEIEFFLDSSGSMIIEDSIYSTSKGDLVFRRPGQLVQGIMPYSCYLICFDMTGESGKSSENYIFGDTQVFQDYYSNEMLNILPPVFHPSGSEKYHHLFDSVLREFIHYNSFSIVLLKSLLLQILFEFHKDVTNPLNRVKIPSVAQYRMLKKIIEYIQDNIKNKLSLSELADITYLSPNYFHKIFTEAMGVTPNEFVTNIKLDRAKELLARTNSVVSDIAIQCGFQSIAYFSYLFKKQTSLTPGEFRNRYKYF